MTVPSYDDLTPGIPDAIDATAADQLALLLRTDHKRSGDHEIRRNPAQKSDTSCPPDLRTSCLYACLRLQTPETADQLRTANCRLLTVARDFSPRVRQASACEILLDVSGLGRLIGPPGDIARQLARAIADARVAAGVAIAPTQTAARLLAHAETGHGLTLRHEDHKDHEDHDERINGLCAGACGRGPWLPLPVAFLRELEVLPPGMNERDRARPFETFDRWGIATLGDLAALPASDLSSRLGRRGIALQRLARGIDPAPFVPDGETPRFTGRLELEWPIEALEPLSFVFARLLEPLSAALERADRGAAAVRLDLRLTDRSTHARVLQLPAPMRDPRVLRTLLLLDLESSAVTAAVDVVAIELDPAPSRITQFSLLQRALPSAETLSTLTARLSALVGESRVGSPVLLDSHRPDAFAMERYAPEQGCTGARGARGAWGARGAGAWGARGAGAWGAQGAWGARGAEGAEGAEVRGLEVLRRQRVPLAIRVSVERGRPVHVASSRRGIPYGAIVQAAGPWRTSGAWWTDNSWNRNEWDVELKSGAVCRIYQDRTTNRWLFDGIYD